MIIVYSFFALILLVFILSLTISEYVMHSHRRKSFHSPDEFNLEFKEVRFYSKDGLELQGCFIPFKDSNKVVIILHGYSGSLDWEVHHAPMLHQAGFNVFLFDFRAHGRSKGNLATFGYKERNDLLGAVNYLRGQGMTRIGVLGFSYGAITAILTAPISPEINAILVDGAPTRLRIALIDRGRELHLPKLLANTFGWLAVIGMSFRLHANLFKYEPIRWVGKISPRPILFIHGELDRYVPDFSQLYNAAREPKSAWVLPKMDHIKASEVYPDEFKQRVLEFFLTNL